jgi:hypothetical protein
MHVIHEITRITALDREAFQQRFERQCEPVIIENGAREWPAFTRWNPEYFVDRVGTVPVRVKKSTTSLHPDFTQDVPISYIRCSVGEYLDRILRGDPAERARYYLSGDEVRLIHRGEIDPTFAPLLADCPPLPHVPQSRLETMSLWVSAQGILAWLHYDGNGCHNLNVQVRGSKEVLLFHPNELPRLYPQTSDERPDMLSFSKVNVANPDFAAYPRFRDARAVRGTIGEGDVLFIPAFWFHSVRHLGEWNVNVNFWWRPSEIPLTRTSFRWIAHAAARTTLEARVRASGQTPDGAAMLRAVQADPLLRASLQQFEGLSVSDAMDLLDELGAPPARAAAGAPAIVR